MRSKWGFSVKYLNKPEEEMYMIKIGIITGSTRDSRANIQVAE